MINKFTIAYLKEHYPNHLAYGVSRMFQLELTTKDIQEANCDLTDCSIVMFFRNYTISIDLLEDYYMITKEYEDYTVRKFYEFDQTLFRSIISFNYNEKNNISLEELNTEDGFVHKRVFVSPKEDYLGDNPIFDKLNVIFPSVGLLDIFMFKDLGKDVQIDKEIYTTNNSLYYSYSPYSNVVYVNGINGFSSIAASLFYPDVNYSGKICEQDRLANIVSRRKPCISLNGDIIFDNGEKSLYIIDIEKGLNNFEISIDIVDKRFESSINKKIFIPIMNWGPISLDEVEMLKNNIGYYVPGELKYLIYKDLNKLKDHIRIAKGDKLRTPDFFDIRFNLYDDFNHLSFDMYEHLDKYIEHTQESVTKGKNKKY